MYEKEFAKLLKNVSKIPSGSTLTIKQIYDPEEWAELSYECRRALGRMFKRAVLNGEIERVGSSRVMKSNSIAYSFK
jgi:hypothetical protein